MHVLVVVTILFSLFEGHKNRAKCISQHVYARTCSNTRLQTSVPHLKILTFLADLRRLASFVYFAWLFQALLRSF